MAQLSKKSRCVDDVGERYSETE